MSDAANESERQRAASVIARLRAAYPDAKGALNFDTPFQLLVATILAAQCTDERVNMVTAKLFAKYPTVAALAESDPDELEQDLKQITFYRNKAKNIRETARIIHERHNDEVPRTIEGVTALPGAARKTANVVLSNAYGIVEGVITDTHVLRISRLLGFTTYEDPIKVERDLMAVLPREDWLDVSHLMAYHGRAVCLGRKPLCERCSLTALCPTGQQRLAAAPADEPAAKAPAKAPTRARTRA